MSKPNRNPIAILLTLCAAALVSACDPLTAMHDTFGGPTSLCSNVDDTHCRRPAPDDLTPN